MLRTVSCVLTVVVVLAGAARSQPGGGPWENDLLLYRSADGEAWKRAGTLAEAGGVPSRIRRASGRLIAAEDEQLTDPFVIGWRGGWRMYFKAQAPPGGPRPK